MGLLDFLMNKEIKLNPEYKNDFIYFKITKGKKEISLLDLDESDEIIKLTKKDIFDIKDNKYLILEYENIYLLTKDEYKFLKLPNIIDTYIYIRLSGFYLSNSIGLKYLYEIYDINLDSKYLISHKNFIRKENSNIYGFLDEKYYNLIKTLDDYNKNFAKNNSKQYEMLEKIREMSKDINIILNEEIKRQDDTIILDNLELDFLPKNEDLIEVIPRSMDLGEEENEIFKQAFRNANISKNFYEAEINGKKFKIVLNDKFKKGLDVVKKHNSLIKKEEFIDKTSPIFDEISNDTDDDINDIEFNYGPRVKELGYLNYRPTPPINNSEIDWFSKSFPFIRTDSDYFELTPNDLSYLNSKMQEENDIVELELGDNKKIRISKENLENEINNLMSSIKNIDDLRKYKSISKLDEIIDIYKENPLDEYLKYDGYFIENPKDLDFFNDLRDELIEEKEIEKREKIEKPKEKVLIIKDNIEEMEYAEKIEEIKNENIKAEIPKCLRKNIKLYSYQKEGLARMQALYKAYPENGLLLCDDMGLGKTIQILSFLAWLKERDEVTPSLIIMPTSLIKNWYNEDKNFKNCGEIQKFFEDNTFKVAILSGKRSEEEILDLANYDIVLTSYESLRINQKYTGKIKWKVLACDEAQKMKNPKTLLTSAIKGQNALFKIACSATPIENSLVDLWCLVDFVKPNLLKDQKTFQKEYVNRLKKDISIKEREEINNNLKMTLSDFYLRRTKDSALSKDFPKKIIVYDKVSPSNKQKENINKLNEFRSYGETPLAIIQGLIMTCSHPLLIQKENIELSSLEFQEILDSCNKLQHIKNILDNIFEKQEKAIIFTKYKIMQEILKRAVVSWYNINVSIINGEKDSSARRRLLDEFREIKGFNVIILSPEAAGVGLNIVEANHVIHYTRHWNPAKEEQATDRAYRIGQTKDTYVYYPIVSYDEIKNGYNRDIYKTADIWVDSQINIDVNDKSPEEKLNKIIIKKKKMLKDFFLASVSDVDYEDFEEFNEEKEDKLGQILITNLDILDDEDFEKLAIALYKKMLPNNKYFLTEKSGDNGVDGIILTENSNYLIQCKKYSPKYNVSKQAYNELLGGEKFYSKELNKKFDKLVIFTSSNKISPQIDSKYDERIVIINREKLARLLIKYPIYYKDLESIKAYTIERMKKEK